MHVEGFIYPKKMAAYDLVITTYETFQREVDFLDLPSFRYGEEMLSWDFVPQKNGRNDIKLRHVPCQIERRTAIAKPEAVRRSADSSDGHQVVANLPGRSADGRRRHHQNRADGAQVGRHQPVVRHG